MIDTYKDLQDFSKSLIKVGFSDSALAKAIVSHVVDQLSCHNGNYAVSFTTKLNTTQILTIQQFLSTYSFHIEYEGTRSDRHWYGIVPNWRK